jgi:hypothetical protein
MIPRPRTESDPVATATMERIRRDFKERLQPPRRQGLQWGAIICALFVGYLGASLAGKQQQPVATVQSPQPVVTAPPNPTPTPTAPRAQLVNHFAPRPIGDLLRVQLPDGRILWTKVCAGVKSLTDLPPTGNQIGDMRYVSGTNAFWVWTTPIGGGLPTWIDP